jgi:toxin ParE1/3/4
MLNKIITRPEAEQDLAEIFDWYEEKRKGLGFDFLLQVDAGLRLLARNPKINSIVYKTIRIHLIKRFPYKIFYFIYEDKIVIVGVIHASRRTTIMKRRTRKKSKDE